MHRLPELKLTLRFEVEVLLKNINVDPAEIEDIIAKNPEKSMYPRLEQIWNTLDRSTNPIRAVARRFFVRQFGKYIVVLL